MVVLLVIQFLPDSACLVIKSFSHSGSKSENELF